jgi:hypothetical protein
MQSLSQNWITEKHIDFEYKKYVLLAYLQHVSEHFTENRLYPHLSELVAHYRNVVALKENKQSLFDSFPDRLSQADFRNLKLLYEKMLEDDQLMKEIESIIRFSIPHFEKYLNEGKQIYDFIESRLHIYPVGIVPLQVNEGYLFLALPDESETMVYEYQITLFENPDEKYRGIYTRFVASYRKSLANTFESIKSDLIRYHKKLPNPATYVIESGLSIPLDETFLPMAKRTLMKYVARAEGAA